MRWLIESDGTLRPLLSAVQRHTGIGRQADRFAAVAPEENDLSSRQERLGYYRLKLGKEHRGQAAIELPAGQVELSVSEIYGRPSQDVRQAIGEPAESSAGGLWLRAVVARDSQWWDRLCGESGAEQGYPTATGFSKGLDLPAGQRQTITVGADSSNESL